jgi:hypothetical protein
MNVPFKRYLHPEHTFQVPWYTFQRYFIPFIPSGCIPFERYVERYVVPFERYVVPFERYIYLLKGIFVPFERYPGKLPSGCRVILEGMKGTQVC